MTLCHILPERRGWVNRMDSAIGELLFAINSCGTNYQDDCCSVLHRDRNKVQLNILEAIYIALDCLSLYRQRSSHTLYILGDVLSTGETSPSSSSSRATSTDIPDPLSPFIASGRSSGLHSVSSQSCWMYVRAGRPAFARPYVGVHKSTSLMSSPLLFQQCPACLVRLTWIVFVTGGRWPYSWCLVRCCRQDLFTIDRSILA